ncbi:helix-hairpin-helix domain-containing protein [Natroniella sulfidigena]|uniref:helix-hairpin-helix domain-containing protein n=1 Tax=Natroniella sulfidigena TaxID=723921 RepID=UPI00200A69A4|nr:helix-hairpin-helix domain-containing protein [Natroniella sulfidigena]MCK8817487.1 helix-hairpin-helix domain-containing protein [Natroniella sulfidigena]
MVRGEQGYITIFVIVILVVIGSLIPLFVQLVTNELQITANYRQMVQEDYWQEGLEVVAAHQVIEELTEQLSNQLVTREELAAISVAGTEKIESKLYDEVVKIDYEIVEIVDQAAQVNLNLHSQEMLESLPEIGEILAERIINNRVYQDQAEILKLTGIGQTTYQDIKDYITVESAGKINLNTACQTVLQTLPEIGETSAEEIVDHRQQEGRYTEVEELKEVVGIGDGTYEQVEDLITVEAGLLQVEIELEQAEQKYNQRIVLDLGG